VKGFLLKEGRDGRRAAIALYIRALFPDSAIGRPGGMGLIETKKAPPP
jgi:hypothetical protein